jgi:hypothetical protein
MEYEELQEAVAVLRFQPMVIIDELCEEFTTVQPYIANLMQVANFDMSVGENWVKASVIAQFDKNCICDVSSNA